MNLIAKYFKYLKYYNEPNGKYLMEKARKAANFYFRDKPHGWISYNSYISSYISSYRRNYAKHKIKD